MLVIAIVIAVLGTLLTVYFSCENIKLHKRKDRTIRELFFSDRANTKFMKFLVNTLSDDSVDPDLREKIFKYLRENKIDLTQMKGGKER